MYKISKRNFLKLSLAGMLGTSYYEATSLHRLQYEFHDLYLPNWNADGLKVAFLTDFHIAGSLEAKRALKAIEMALNQKPNLLLFGGDFIEGNKPVNFSSINQVLERFNDISIPCYGVYGNHDHSSPLKKRLFESIKNSNLKILQNEIIETHNIQIIGIDDPYTGHSDYSFLKNKKLFSSRICLMHTPDCIEQIPYKISIQLSGHSHGGQICLPFGIPLILPPGGKKYSSGYYPNASSPLYVSRGIGTTDIDLRTFCPPEVSILTLKSIF